MTPDHVLDLVGNTPLLEIRHRSVSPGVCIFAKWEGHNPSGSIKDRITKQIVLTAEAQGELTPEKVIVEASSGNTGISMGMLCRLKGYRAKIFMPETKSLERRQMLKAWGAELVLTSGEDHTSHITGAEELVAREGERYFYLNQNGSALNTLAHYETTGVEILDQLDGRVDAFVAGFGTGGTLAGVGRRLKEHNPRVQVVSVEPAGEISRIDGLLHLDGSYTPGIYEPDLIDRHLLVEDADALRTTREIAEQEGVFAGISSGAVLYGALQVAETLGRGNVVCIFADRGERYLSTGVFDAPRA